MPTTYDAAGNITVDTKFRNLKYLRPNLLDDEKGWVFEKLYPIDPLPLSQAPFRQHF